MKQDSWPYLTRRPTKETASENRYAFIDSMAKHYGPSDELYRMCNVLERPQASRPFQWMYFSFDDRDNYFEGWYAPALTDTCGVVETYSDTDRRWSCSQGPDADCCAYDTLLRKQQEDERETLEKYGP